MIFVSFGNSPKPFMRLAEAVDRMAEVWHESVVVQNGHTDSPFKYCKCIPFMDRNTYISHLRGCEIAILQGGWGVSEASDMGCKVIAVPRRKGEEHYHDQGQLIRKLEEDGVCLGCYDTANLIDLMIKAKIYPFKPIKRGDASKVINDFISSL